MALPIILQVVGGDCEILHGELQVLSFLARQFRIKADHEKDEEKWTEYTERAEYLEQMIMDFGGKRPHTVRF
jgi:hypothetical protein